MIERLVGELWAEMRTASPERWVLVAAAIGSAIVLAALARVDHPLVLACVMGFAAIAALQPASNAGLATMAIVLARWLATADDATTPDTAALAIGLITFHLSLAVMATVPQAITLDPRLRRRWLLRLAGLAGIAMTTWVLVEVFTRRALGTSTALATAAVLAIAAGAGAVRASLSRSTR